MSIVVLTAQQTNKSRHELLGPGIMNLFGKPADGDGEIVYQRISFPELGFFYLKNGGDI